MRRFVWLVAVAAVAVLPAQARQTERLQGAWLQTAPAWSITADNPWTVMIFNADGTFCGGSAKDQRYADEAAQTQVRIDPGMQQNLGIRSAEVKTGTLEAAITVPGTA